MVLGKGRTLCHWERGKGGLKIKVERKQREWGRGDCRVRVFFHRGREERKNPLGPVSTSLKGRKENSVRVGSRHSSYSKAKTLCETEKGVGLVGGAVRCRTAGGGCRAERQEWNEGGVKE